MMVFDDASPTSPTWAGYDEFCAEIIDWDGGNGAPLPKAEMIDWNACDLARRPETPRMPARRLDFDCYPTPATPKRFVRELPKTIDPRKIKHHEGFVLPPVQGQASVQSPISSPPTRLLPSLFAANSDGKTELDPDCTGSTSTASDDEWCASDSEIKHAPPTPPRTPKKPIRRRRASEVDVEQRPFQTSIAERLSRRSSAAPGALKGGPPSRRTPVQRKRVRSPTPLVKVEVADKGDAAAYADDSSCDDSDNESYTQPQKAAKRSRAPAKKRVKGAGREPIARKSQNRVAQTWYRQKEKIIKERVLSIMIDFAALKSVAPAAYIVKEIGSITEALLSDVRVLDRTGGNKHAEITAKIESRRAILRREAAWKKSK